MLHTRISADLAQDIYRVAEDLRIPVSNLVRNVLEDVFSVMESVTDNVGHLIEDVMDEAERVRERIERHRRRAWADTTPPGMGDQADVLGWQPLLLERNVPCARCGAKLAKGDEALLGIGPRGPTGTVICCRCLGRS